MKESTGAGVLIKDGTALLPGLPDIPVALRRSAQTRRLNLRVSGLDGRVSLSMPPSLPLAEALAFLREKEDWLRAAVNRVAGPQPVMPGSDILLRGEKVRIIESGHIQRVTESKGALLVPTDRSGDRTAVRVATYLRAAAQASLLPASEDYARILGRRFAAVALRDTRSRWGSCTAQGRLMYSWRLIMAPPKVLRYVAAHEVAHLVHMDHSPAFWACVRGLMPEYPHHRAWLRAHGAELHSYCFRARPLADRG
ncbi:MAG: M48 family metallopeptidase [Roseinatronobacter sp.]|nr:M48 family metallopeptidase [Roseinatronobacter sp.]